MHWLLWVLIVCGGFACFILGYLYFKIIHPLRKAMKAVKDVTGMSISDFESSPLMDLVSDFPEFETYITLANEDAWGSEQEVFKAIAEYEALDFQKVGTYYGVPDFEQAEVLIHPLGSILCIGESNDELQAKVVLLGIFDDDSCIYVSNNTTASILPSPEKEIRVQRTSMPAGSILEDFEKLRAGRELKKMTKANFVEEFKKLERRRCLEIASKPEIVDAVINGLDDSDNMLTQTARQSFSELITNCCRHQYLAEANYTAVEWEKIRDFLVVVHDRSIVSSVLEDGYDETKGLDSMDFQKIMEESCRSITRAEYKIKIATYPEQSRPKLLGAISEPVPADIYQQNS